MAPVPPRVRELLATAELDGTHVRFPEQLDRADYVAVNKVLENLGGKWNRKAGAHVFPTDPSDAVARILAGDAAPAPARTTEGYVRTPDDLADYVVRNFTEIEEMPARSRVLEPSAGDGSFIDAIHRANSEVWVDAVEPNRERLGRDVMGRAMSERVGRFATTLEEFAAAKPAHLYDAVVMNPPFALPGQATAWIDHVRLAWTLLAPGGRLTAIVPAGFLFREDRGHREMRALVEAHGSSISLPDDAFRSSGTGVRTVLLWVEKPILRDNVLEDAEPAGQLALFG